MCRGSIYFRKSAFVVANSSNLLIQTSLICYFKVFRNITFLFGSDHMETDAFM